MIPFEPKEAVIALKENKKQTNFSNIAVAEELDINAETVAKWLNNQTLPSAKSCKKIKTFIEDYGVPGIVELPPNPGHWTAPYFIRVADIENPFFTWYVENSYNGNTPEEDYELMEDYYKKYQEHPYDIKIRLIYPDKNIARLRAYHDIQSYGMTIELLHNYTPQQLYSSEYNCIGIAPDIIKERFGNEKAGKT